jgi:hypothetical protein
MSTPLCDEDCSEPACGDGFFNASAVVAGGGHTEQCDDSGGQ